MLVHHYSYGFYSTSSWLLLLLPYFLLPTTQAQLLNNLGAKFLKPAPWDYSNVNNYTFNPTWLIGSTVHITWTNVAMIEYNITLSQQVPFQGGNGSHVGSKAIYKKTANDPERGPEGINWTVSTQGLEKTYDSNIFYLVLQGPIPADVWTTFGILSHYFNVTTNRDDPAVRNPPPGLASESPSPQINPYLNRKQTADQQQTGNSGGGGNNNNNNDNAESKRARDIGLGVGLGIGIPALALATLSGWLALRVKKLQKTAGAMPLNSHESSPREKDATEHFGQQQQQQEPRTELPSDATRRVELGGHKSMVPELPAGSPPPTTALPAFGGRARGESPERGSGRGSESG